MMSRYLVGIINGILGQDARGADGGQNGRHRAPVKVVQKSDHREHQAHHFGTEKEPGAWAESIF